MPHEIVALVGVLSVFGMPSTLIAMFMRQRHQQKMRALETSVEARKLAELEAARADLEARVRTLETIVTDGDRDLDERLRRLSQAAKPALPEPQADRRLLERPR
jgi:regulator of protease activity HflC (stomatin/prohibitin superfamily)